MDNDKLTRLLAITLRDEAIDRLLRGNDTGCFTTEQYRQVRLFGNSDYRGSEAVAKAFTIEIARAQLLGEGKFRPSPVREVKPDVWIAGAVHTGIGV